MRTLDKKVKRLRSKPFAAIALFGLLGFGFDFALHSAVQAASGRDFALDSPLFRRSAHAAEIDTATETEENSTKNAEAKVQLLFKKNNSSFFHPRYWVEGMDRFERLAK